jgi:hypothetical protein
VSDWAFLSSARCTVPSRYVPERFCSNDSDGFNGMFRFGLDGHSIRCIASDGMGWQHVSVSVEFSDKPPTWSTMCKIKDLFWDDEDVVVQFHPKKSEYVNFHPGCLHLWRCTDGREFPTPSPLMVGPLTK